MRRHGFLIGLVIGNFIPIIVIMLAGAQPPQKKYWQDELLKPNQGWIEAYGYTGESVLAFNVKSLIMANNAHDAAIRRMAAELLGDPNDPRPEVPQPGNAEQGKPIPTGRDVPGVPATRPLGGKSGGK